MKAEGYRASSAYSFILLEPLGCTLRAKGISLNLAGIFNEGYLRGRVEKGVG